MATVIRTLAARLALESETFNNAVRQANRELKEFQKDIKPTKDLIKDLGVGMLAAGAAVAGSMLAMTKAAADYGDSINKASVQTGISTEQLSRLKFVADQTESSFAGVSNGLKFLAKNAAAAADGTKAQEEAFRDLGVSVTDSTGKLRPMNSLLLDVADKFKLMEDGTEKAALAQKLFGKSGIEMIPVLNLGSAGISQMGDEAERLGLVLSKEAAKAGDDFNDSMTAVNASVLGLSNSVAQALLPALTATANFIRDSVATITAFAKEHETLTKMIFGTALAIAGAGGLLLAVVAIGAASGPFWVGIAAVKAFGLSLSGLALTGGPILLVVAAIGLTIGKLWELKTAWDDTREAWKFARFAANETVGTYVKLAETQTVVIKKLTQEQQFAKRLADERVKDSKDSDKQFALYVKNVEEVEKKEKERWKAFMESHRQMTKVTVDLTAALSVHRTREHQMFEASERDRDDALAGIRRYNDFRIDLERSTNNQLETELDRNTRALVATIIKGRAEDQRNWDEQGAIDAAREQKRIAQAIEDAGKWGRVWEDAMGNVVAGFARGVADMILEGKGFGETMKGIFKELASTIIQVLVTEAFTKVAKGLSDLIPGFGSGAASAASGAAGAAGSVAGAAGSAGSAASSAAGSASSLASGALSGGIAAAGAIVGAMMGEGNFRRIEENTRETRDWLELTGTAWNPLFHQIEHLMEFTIHPLLREIKDILGEIRSAPGVIGGAGGGQTLVFSIDGRALATILIPHTLSLSTNNAMRVIGI